MNINANTICADSMHADYTDNVLFAELPDLLTMEDMQKALGVGRSMAYRLIRDGSIRHMRIGKAIKIPKRFLIDFVLSSCYNNDVAMGNSSCHNEEGLS